MTLQNVGWVRHGFLRRNPTNPILPLKTGFECLGLSPGGAYFWWGYAIGKREDMRLCATRGCLGAGAAGSWLLSLNGQRKVTKESRPSPPPSATLRVPCAARRTGRLRNSRCALRQCSPTTPGPAVLLGGGARGPKNIPHPHPGLPLEGEGTVPLSPAGRGLGRGGVKARIAHKTALKSPSAPPRFSG